MTEDKTLPLFKAKHEHTLLCQPRASPELKPCRSCGNAKVELYNWECICGIGGYAVICWACTTELPKSNESADEAIKVWNEEQ